VVQDEEIVLLCKDVEAVQKRISGCIVDFLKQNPTVCRIDSEDEMAFTRGCAENPESANFSDSKESSFGSLGVMYGLLIQEPLLT